MTLRALDLSWLWSPKEYWYSLVGGLIGAAIGIRWTLRRLAKKETLHRELCLCRLRTCIEFNIDRLQQAREQLGGSVIPNYPLDGAQLYHWLTQCHDFIPSELLRELDWQRFQLDYISSTFIVANTAVVSNACNALVVPEPHACYQLLVKALSEHVNLALEDLPPLLNQMPKSE
jgi:hypothetical protein